MDAGPTAGEPVAATAEAGEHFIGDQQGTGITHQPFHLAQEGTTHHGHATGTLQQRFQDHRGRRPLQGGCQHFECGLFPGVYIRVIPPGGRPGHPRHRKQLVFERFAEQVAFPNGHRTEGVTVIRAIERHDLVAWLAPVHPPLAGDLQRHFHGGGSVVGKEQPFQPGDGTQPFTETFRRGMGEVRENHLLKTPGLLSNRLGHHRVAVAMQRHPPAADGIDQRATLLPQQQGAFPADHPLGRRSGGHLGERRPEIRMP